MKAIRIVAFLAVALLAAAAVADEKQGTGIPGLDTRPRTAEEAKAAADRLEKLYKGKRQPESVRMFLALARGKGTSPPEGWWGPAQTRYDWKWLVKHQGAPAKGGLRAKDFKGPPALFARLDRNKDGQVTPDDLDWSDRNPYIQMSYMVGRLYRMMDAKGKGQITKADLEAFFDKAAGGKDHLTADDLRDALLAGMGGAGFLPGDGPSVPVLLKGLFNGEIGSLQEGPNVGDTAPDFELATADGKKSIKLSNLLGKKPVVLVFGNFTCGPFRSMYPQVEDVLKRHKGKAEALLVYVREAHPTDGWRMKSNDKVGVRVAQPTTTAERCDVAGQCAAMLKPSIPLVVDKVDDKVGNAYSGMPARLYVIDAEGKVAYKGGRGPFGFKAGEMEQALVMALLEAAEKKEDGGE